MRAKMESKDGKPGESKPGESKDGKQSVCGIW